MKPPSISLLTVEITRPRDTPSGPERLTLTEEQLAALQACIDWKNERLRARPDDVKSKHAYAEVFTTPDGYHKVRVGGVWYYDIKNWCIIYEDFKRRLGMEYRDLEGEGLWKSSSQ